MEQGPHPWFLGPLSIQRPITVVVSDHDYVHHTLENLDIGSWSGGHRQAPLVQPRRFTRGWWYSLASHISPHITQPRPAAPSRKEIRRFESQPCRILNPHFPAFLPESNNQQTLKTCYVRAGNIVESKKHPEEQEREPGLRG